MRLISVPIPKDMGTQRYILSHIDIITSEIDKARSILKKMRANASEILDAASNEVFCNLTTHSKIRLKYLTTAINSGSTPKNANYSSEGIPFIRSLNVLWNEFSKLNLVLIDPTTHEHMKRSQVQKGDVLLNITGASIGRACCAPDAYIPSNVNQHVCIIDQEVLYLDDF